MRMRDLGIQNNETQMETKFVDFLDCHTSCFQTLLSCLQISGKQIEITRVLLQFEFGQMYKMVENLELYGKICETCARQAVRIFNSYQIKIPSQNINVLLPS